MRCRYNFLNALILAKKCSYEKCNQKLHHVKCYGCTTKTKFLLEFRLFCDNEVVENVIIDHDLRKKIKILVKTFLSFIVFEFNMMKLLVVIQVKAGETMIKESHFSAIDLFILFSLCPITRLGMSQQRS